MVNVFIAVNLLLSRANGTDHLPDGEQAFQPASAVSLYRLFPQFGLYLHPSKGSEGAIHVTIYGMTVSEDHIAFSFFIAICFLRLTVPIRL